MRGSSGSLEAEAAHANEAFAGKTTSGSKLVVNSAVSDWHPASASASASSEASRATGRRSGIGTPSCLRGGAGRGSSERGDACGMRGIESNQYTMGRSQNNTRGRRTGYPGPRGGSSMRATATATAAGTRASRRTRDEAQKETGRLGSKAYEKELRKLHVELVKLQEWVKHAGLRVCVLFEGRDG